MLLDKIKNLFLILFLFCYLDAQSYASSVATSTANWLHLDASVRSIGMGRAQVASGEGVSSISDNPAHVSLIEGTQLYASQTSYIAGIEYGTLAYGMQSGNNNFIAFNLFYLDSGKMKETNIAYPDGTGALFSVSSFSFRFTYGMKIMQQLNIGISGKYFREGIADSELAKMSGLAIDIGSTYTLQGPGIVIGTSFNNIGPNVQFRGDGLDVTVPDTLETGGVLAKITQDFPLPFTMKFGVSKELSINNHNISLACDMNKSLYYSPYFNIGAEYTFNNMLSARFGTFLGHDTAFYSVGLGGNIGNIQVDYGLSNYSIFDMTHQFSLQLGL